MNIDLVLNPIHFKAYDAHINWIQSTMFERLFSPIWHLFWVPGLNRLLVLLIVCLAYFSFCWLPIQQNSEFSHDKTRYFGDVFAWQALLNLGDQQAVIAKSR